MSNPESLNRRQWLKAAGLTMAGAALAPRLAKPASDPRSVLNAGGNDASASGPPAESKGERRYIHGFETYPPV